MKQPSPGNLLPNNAESAQFHEGFTARSILGIFFIGVVMAPGSMYLNLVAGASLGGAAEWVTIILFVEIAKRSFTVLRRQEIYLLYYVAVAMMGSELGSAAFGPLWSQYLVQSDAAREFGLVHDIPRWVAPAPDSEALAHRTLLHPDWLPALGLIVAGLILSRVSWFSLAYVLFRTTSDVEKLSFPLAPVVAEGATALAETSSGREGWRWRVFSIGSVIGIAFGALYVGIPTFSGALTGQPVFLLPIPWVDLTHATERVLPAAPVGFTTGLGAVMIGFVLPFWVVVGSFIGAVLSMVINPLLYKTGFLTSWHPGMDTIQIIFANNVDFWLSFGMGVTFAVAIVGLVQTIRALARAGWRQRGTRIEPPKGRGDFPTGLAISAYIMATMVYILISRFLVPGFPVLFFFFFGFVFTPINSYINARMIGITGQYLGIPFVREGTFILSGYKGAGIWFAPIPIANYGGFVQRFRELELTRTRFTSLLKAEATMVPVILVCSIIFWAFIWKLGPIPSPSYPFAQKMWHLQALNQCLWISGTMSRESWVALEDGGVAVFERDQWIESDDAGMFDGIRVNQVMTLESGERWVATEQGIFQLTREGTTRYRASDGLPSDWVNAVALDRDGGIWAACRDAAAHFDGSEWHLLEAGEFKQVLIDQNDIVWFVKDSTVSRYRVSGAERLDDGDLPPQESIEGVVEARDGKIWLASGQGIFSFDGRRWNEENSEAVFTFTQDTLGQRWYVVTEGILHHDEGWVKDTLPPGAEGEEATMITAAGEDLWLAAGNNIWRRSKGKWENLSEKENGPQAGIRTIDAQEDQRWLLKALKPKIIFSGLGTGLLGLVGLSLLGLPVTLVYGVIRSLGAIPHMLIPEIIGALLGRYYFAKRFGKENWARYVPVLAAGFACGMGLIGMASVAFVLAAKAVIAAPY
jgi:hypothetical protein